MTSGDGLWFRTAITEMDDEEIYVDFEIDGRTLSTMSVPVRLVLKQHSRTSLKLTR